MLNRDSILADLRDNVCEVAFTKVDGENRVMRCSLRRDLLPPKYIQEEAQEKTFHKENPDVIAAFDVQKGAWRSFRIESIHYIQVVDSY